MKKTLVVFGCCLLATAALAGCKPKAPAVPQGGNENANQAVNTNTAPAEESFSGSVNDVLKKGVPTKCTFSQEVDGARQSGIAYISGTNVRTEMDMTVEGKTVTSHMIKAGDTQYIWSDMTPNKGTKFTFTEEEMKAIQAKSQPENKEQNVDLDTKVDMKCVPWTVDISLLTPPGNVVFTDVTAMMKAALNQGTVAPTDRCAICDQVPASVKDQCLQSCK